MREPLFYIKMGWPRQTRWRGEEVTIHGTVRFYAPASVRAKRVPLAHGTVARPPPDKVMVQVGIRLVAVGNFKWLDAITICGRLGREL